MEDVVSATSRVSSESVDVGPTSSSSEFQQQQQQVVDAEIRSSERESGSLPEQPHIRHRQRPHNRRNLRSGLYQPNISTFQDVPIAMTNRTCSVFLVIFTIWIFACMTVMSGFYGPSTMQFGPNSSRLIKVNPFFVQSIQVNEIHESISGATLYGFDKLPSLDVNLTWSESHDAYIESGDHKEWPYFLNKGSKINISYNVRRPISAGLAIIIAEGSDSHSDWIEDRSYANTTWPWYIVHGNGTIEHQIHTSKTYFIAVGNLIFEDVEVQLNYTIIATGYNTSQASYKCTRRHDLCTLELNLFGPNAVVLTSPGPELATSSYNWYVELSYGQRWMSYIVGSVSTSVLVLIVMRILNFYLVTRENYGTGTEAPSVTVTDGRSPLLATEDDLSGCSSYSEDSMSNDEEVNEPLKGLALDGRQDLKVEQSSNHDGRNLLCVTCSDAFRDSFFLPCGHCAECFTCGTRTIQEKGDCPICSRVAKKVRKIFIV